MRRHALGIIAVLLIAGGLVLFSVGGSKDFWSSICLRAGLTMGALWLALPEIASLGKRQSVWVWALVIACAVAVLRFPKSMFLLAPLIGVLLVLHFFRWLFTPLPPRKQKAAGKSDGGPSGS